MLFLRFLFVHWYVILQKIEQKIFSTTISRFSIIIHISVNQKSLNHDTY